MEQQTFQSASSFIQAGIDLLGRDEAARKRNADKIKNAAKIKIALDLSQEVQGIWKNANSNITNSVIPGWAQAYAGIQSGFALGRAAIQTAKVNQQKFGLGGLLKFGLGGLKKMGIFGGRPHSSGGTKGYFEDGTQIEVEKDELFAVVNKRDTRLLNALSTANSRNGNAFFQDGGLLGLNTTPSNSFSTNNIGGSDFDFSELIMEFRMMRRENAQRNNTLQAFVSLDDLNAAQSQLSSIENEAAL